MSTPSVPVAATPSTSRPVLIWQEEGDESFVKADVAQAAAFLKVSADAVLAAIAAGDPLGGWFVDWEAPAAASA